MHIAQLSVAGEAGTRLEPANSQPQSDDQRALAEYACDRSNLPWIVFRAAHRATHISALPARARAVLAALARTVDAGRPYAAIFARRELLTGRALQSMRTFYRSLDDLEVAGLIVRAPQMRYGGAGLFGRAYLHLTRKATAVLGLVESKADAAARPVFTSEQAALPAHTVSFATPSVTVADGAIYKDLFPTTQKRQPGRLPADLTRLLNLGFREFLIFKLMREAREHGKRLSDVVEATWNHLQRATHPISYLRTLLRVPVDFAHRVRSVRTATETREAQRAHDAHIGQATQGLAGKAFASSDGTRRYFVANDATAITIQHCDEKRPRVHTGAWARDFLAALQAGLIVAADSEHDDPLACAPRHQLDVQRLESAPAATPRIVEHLANLKRMLRLKAAGSVTTSTWSKESEPAPSQANVSGQATVRLERMRVPHLSLAPD